MSQPTTIPVLSDDWNWQLRSACRGMSAAVFFNPDNERGRNKRNREANAKAICQTCPVMRDCLDWALRIREPYGVWGGATAEERVDLLTGRMSTDQIIPADSLRRRLG